MKNTTSFFWQHKRSVAAAIATGSIGWLERERIATALPIAAIGAAGGTTLSSRLSNLPRSFPFLRNMIAESQISPDFVETALKQKKLQREQQQQQKLEQRQVISQATQQPQGSGQKKEDMATWLQRLKKEQQMGKAGAGLAGLAALVTAANMTPEGEAERNTMERLLAELVSIDTTSSHDETICKSNAELVFKLKEFFDARGIEYWERVDTFAKKEQVTLVARIGPAKEGGVLFSTHTDVVPAQGWEKKPFGITENGVVRLEKEGGKIFGRGTADTKVNIVSNLLVADFMKKQEEDLERPVYFAFSWGEEIGCQGTKHVISLLEQIKAKPELIVVGEPTNGEIVTGHMGAAAYRYEIQGVSRHSSRPELGINAVLEATTILTKVKELNQEFATSKGSLEYQVGKMVDTVFASGNTRKQNQAIHDAISYVLMPSLPSDTLLQFIENKERLKILLIDNIAAVYPDDPDKFQTFLEAVQRPEAGLPDDNPLKTYKGRGKYHDEYFNPPYPSINPTGGSKSTTPNRVPDDFTGVLHARLTPGFDLETEIRVPLDETIRERNAEIAIRKAEIQKECPVEVSPGITLKPISHTRPLSVQAKTPTLERVQEQYKKVTGHESTTKTESFGAEAGELHEWTQKKGYHTCVVMTGQGHMTINGGHEPNEFISEEQLADAAKLHLALTTEFCMAKYLDKRPGSVILPSGSPTKVQGQAHNRQQAQMGG